LREYGLPPQIWDGDENCKHEWNTVFKPPMGGKNHPDRPANVGSNRYLQDSDLRGKGTYSNFCIHCDAWRGSLGLEPTFQLYIQHLKQIFAEVKRVLKKTGTCFVNIGDTYGTKSGGMEQLRRMSKNTPQYGAVPYTDGYAGVSQEGKKNAQSKSLCQIPERFTLMMTDELGFIKRNTIVWWKRNCMPSSAKDRFTVDFEKLFFFTKSKKYYFEQQFEPYTAPLDRWGGDNLKADGKSTWDEGTGQTTYRDRSMRPDPQGRNKRAVWDIPTQPFPDSHFAVFPEKLIETPILAGCPKEICNKCGKAREKIYKGTSQEAFNIRVRDVKEGRIKHTDRVASESEIDNYQEGISHVGEGRKFIGYTDCGCNAGFHPGVVLDPFIGSGTTGKVALAYGRNYIGFDLGYGGMSKKRTDDVQLEAFN